MLATRFLSRCLTDCDRRACWSSAVVIRDPVPDRRIQQPSPGKRVLGRASRRSWRPNTGRTASSLNGGVGWINRGPIILAELKGKIVLLDFWTFCCINCHHILPDLAKLEAKYKNELVVIGVHSAKFDAEQRHREHPPQGRRIPDQAPGHQRRRTW